VNGNLVEHGSKKDSVLKICVLQSAKKDKLDIMVIVKRMFAFVESIATDTRMSYQAIFTFDISSKRV